MEWAANPKCKHVKLMKRKQNISQTTIKRSTWFWLCRNMFMTGYEPQHNFKLPRVWRFLSWVRLHKLHQFSPWMLLSVQVCKYVPATWNSFVTYAICVAVIKTSSVLQVSIICTSMLYCSRVFNRNLLICTFLEVTSELNSRWHRYNHMYIHFMLCFYRKLTLFCLLLPFEQWQLLIWSFQCFQQCKHMFIIHETISINHQKAFHKHLSRYFINIYRNYYFLCCFFLFTSVHKQNTWFALVRTWLRCS